MHSFHGIEVFANYSTKGASRPIKACTSKLLPFLCWHTRIATLHCSGDELKANWRSTPKPAYNKFLES